MAKSFHIPIIKYVQLNPATVNRILQTYKKQGKILPTGSWKKFLKSHWNSLFGMDFMTVDTLFGKIFYLLIILELKSRSIVQYDLTENPCREFVRQRIELFSEEFPDRKTLIYDNAPQFKSIDYSWYGIEGVNICTSSPNMNAYTKWVVGSVRHEALDHFLLFTEKQVRNIVEKYIEYYNFVVLVRLFYRIDQNNQQRPHQGVGGIPDPRQPIGIGKIRKDPVLGGLHHNYYRSSA